MNVLYLLPLKGVVLHGHQLALEYKDLYVQRSCPRCHDIKAEFRSCSLDVRIVGSIELSGPSLGIWPPYSIDIVRRDLCDFILRHSRDFSVGNVYLNNVIVPEFLSLIPQSTIRVPFNGNDKSTTYPCKTCGRRCEMLIDEWLSRDDLGDREVFSRAGGGGLYITDTILHDLPDAVRTELKFEQVSLR